MVVNTQKVVYRLANIVYRGDKYTRHGFAMRQIVKMIKHLSELAAEVSYANDDRICDFIDMLDELGDDATQLLEDNGVNWSCDFYAREVTDHDFVEFIHRGRLEKPISGVGVALNCLSSVFDIDVEECVLGRVLSDVDRFGRQRDE